MSARFLLAICALFLSPASALHSQTGTVAGASPRLINPEEFNDYCESLVLSQAQRAYADTLFQQYQEQLVNWLNDAMLELQRIDEQVYREIEQAGNSALVMEWCDVAVRKQIEIVSRIADAERLLFEQLLPVLAEVQLSSLERVRMARQRQSCVNLQFEAMYNAARIDLSTITRSVLEPDAVGGLDDLLFEYEQVITPAMVHAERAYYDMRLKTQAIYREKWTAADGSYIKEGQPGHWEGFVAAAHASRETSQPALELQRRVGDINKQFLEKLAAVLKPADAKKLRARFREAVYPRAFPIVPDPAEVIEQFTELPLEQDQRDAVNAAVEAFERRLEEVNIDMADAWADQQRQFATHGYLFPIGFEERVRTGRARRWELIDDLLKQVRLIVEPQAGSELDTWLSDFTAELNATREKAKADRYPGW